MNYRSIDWLNYWSIDWLNHWLIDRLPLWAVSYQPRLVFLELCSGLSSSPPCTWSPLVSRSRYIHWKIKGQRSNVKGQSSKDHLKKNEKLCKKWKKFVKKKVEKKKLLEKMKKKMLAEKNDFFKRMFPPEILYRTFNP